MMQKLNDVMINETQALNVLLLELENQHKNIVTNDVFGMEACVNKIKEANKNIAHMEVLRRKITENKAMGPIIEAAKDIELEKNFHAIKLLLQAVVLQKDTNELLIRQGLSFTNRMLNVLNPVRESKTYNGYGKVKR
ncbi:flagellar protein FlgN [Clostridium estertheticum]|uniref:flagellar export chaperone FlgN n=1 Tax=Clostridium estertheticum TaxID=238834 RepID=UPI001C0BFC64|nr:flagellar export chaperone FlgN [Clostridium estertheticum]MBU3214288.1 flagellar protein FlgN [Clostridium estertheticum]WAG54698.1 flagellar protein FlgN [Clostridium estertheticum]